MPIHQEALQAARRICLHNGKWTFTPHEVVRALPHLNASSVRTHIVSRCCVNAPQNHPHKWDYFRRVARGLYEIRPAYRRTRKPIVPARAVAERGPSYARGRSPLQDMIHAVVRRDRSTFVAECLEVAVVTQGRSLDEVVSNLREAVELHLEGESPALLGLVARPKLAVQYELAVLGDGVEA